LSRSHALIVAAAILIALVGSMTLVMRELQAPRPTATAELRRCRGLGAVAVDDATSEAAWRDARRDFLAKPKVAP
jgi:conjugative transfer region protein TrbK